MYSKWEKLDMLKWLKEYLQYRIRVLREQIPSDEYIKEFGDIFQDDRAIKNLYEEEIINIDRSIDDIIKNEI